MSAGSPSRANPLAVMLIISAIDVLLCAFTATITLFFLGGGQATSNTNDEVGWAGVLVLTETTPNVALSTEFPNEVVSPSAVFRLDAIPTELRPARFQLGGAASGPLVIDVTVVHEGQATTPTHITCNRPSGEVFRLDGTVVRPGTGCHPE